MSGEYRGECKVEDITWSSARDTFIAESVDLVLNSLWDWKPVHTMLSLKSIGTLCQPIWIFRFDHNLFSSSRTMSIYVVHAARKKLANPLTSMNTHTLTHMHARAKKQQQSYK